MSLKTSMLCLYLLAAAPIAAESAQAATEQNLTMSVADIDQQIKKLKSEYAQCQLTESQASDLADRLINLNDWIGYRQAVARETRAENRMVEIEAEIKACEAKKQQLLGK